MKLPTANAGDVNAGDVDAGDVNRQSVASGEDKSSVQILSSAVLISGTRSPGAMLIKKSFDELLHVTLNLRLSARR